MGNKMFDQKVLDNKLLKHIEGGDIQGVLASLKEGADPNAFSGYAIKLAMKADKAGLVTVLLKHSSADIYVDEGRALAFAENQSAYNTIAEVIPYLDVKKLRTSIAGSQFLIFVRSQLTEIDLSYEAASSICTEAYLMRLFLQLGQSELSEALNKAQQNI